MLDTNDYKKILLEMKQDLTHRITAIDKDIRHEGMTADWSEQASERENDEVLESLGNSSKQELSMIKYALKRTRSSASTMAVISTAMSVAQKSRPPG